MKCINVFGLLALLLITLPKCFGNLLGVEVDESGKEYLNEYVSLDENKYMNSLQEFEESAIEIDLIDDNKKKNHQLQEPRVLYQIGVSIKLLFIYLKLWLI